MSMVVAQGCFRDAFCCLRDDERRPRIFKRCVKMFDEVQFFSHKNNTHPFTKNDEKGCVLKTAEGKAKTLENTRFSRVLELLGRFELPTSSLPTSLCSFFLVAIYRSLSPQTVDMTAFAGFLFCSPSCAVVPRCMLFFDGGVPFGVPF